jgi:hypothetical protein
MLTEEDETGSEVTGSGTEVIVEASVISFLLMVMCLWCCLLESC